MAPLRAEAISSSRRGLCPSSVAVFVLENLAAIVVAEKMLLQRRALSEIGSLVAESGSASRMRWTRRSR
jgi:hypothetical protein